MTIRTTVTFVLRNSVSDRHILSMKFLLMTCLLALAGAAMAGRYRDDFDYINVKEVLGNRRLLEPYLLCVLDEGKCTPPGRELRSHIREALATSCADCTPAQVKGTRQVIAHLINHEPKYWNKLTAKYDPSGQYTKKYERELRTTPSA